MLKLSSDFVGKMLGLEEYLRLRKWVDSEIEPIYGKCGCGSKEQVILQVGLIMHDKASPELPWLCEECAKKHLRRMIEKMSDEEKELYEKRLKAVGFITE